MDNKKISLKYSLGRNLFLFLLLLSISLPTDFVSVKFFILALILSLILFFLVNDSRFYINKEFVFFALFFSMVGFVYTFYGLLNNNPGALKTITVFVIYPLLFTSMAFYFREKDDLIKVRNVLLYSCFAVVLVQLSFMLSAYGVLPKNIAQYFQLAHPGSAVLHLESNYFLFTLPNVSSLLFLIPFLMTHILLSTKVSFKFLILLGSMFILIFLTGRRAFFVSFLLSFLFLLLIGSRGGYIYKMISRFSYAGSFLVLLLVSLISLSDMDLSVYFEKMHNILNFSTNESNLERVYQFNSLLDGISESPIFGHGAGAAADYSRSASQPWAYELSYVALVFQYGFLGFMLYFAGVLYLVFNLIRMCSNRLMQRDIRTFLVAYLVGMISFLIANATNPYLGKFDYMWVIFLPVLFLNAYKTNKKSFY